MLFLSAAPECDPTFFENVTSPNAFSVYPTDYKYLSVFIMDCDEGYKKENDDTNRYMCGSNGEWIKDQYRGNPIQCARE